MPAASGSVTPSKGHALRRQRNPREEGPGGRGIAAGPFASRGRRLRGVRVDADDGAVDEPVFLERVRGDLDASRLARPYEPRIGIGDGDLRFERIPRGHQRQQHGAGSDDGPDGVRREVLDDAGLRCTQLDGFRPDVLLRQSSASRARCDAAPARSACSCWR